MSPDNNLNGRWNRMKEHIDLGEKLVIAISLALILFSKDRLASAFSMENFPVTQLSILLLLETLILIFLWIHAAKGELHMFQDNFEEFVPPVTGLYYGISVFFFNFPWFVGIFFI